MAVDTRDKRMSMLGLGSPIPRVLPNPDATIGDNDRFMFIYLYHGISLAGPGIGNLLFIFPHRTGQEL